MLGMYIHTHWAYNHPYAARTWEDSDWEAYLGGLAELGYDFIMVWPQMDSMPATPTPSDVAWLRTLSRAIDVAHDRFGMRVSITACPNTIGNEEAEGYEFRQRPYFVCEEKINPGDPAAVDAFIEGRRRALHHLANADALVVIDSDPGGYIGSKNPEFVELCRRQIEVMREANPAAEFIYWMLAGWESYNAFWAKVAVDPGADHAMWRDWNGEDFPETLSLMADAIPEPWWLYGWLPEHQSAIRELGMTDKAMLYPYGVIEGEPTFPLTNCNPGAVVQQVSAWDRGAWPRGIMANAQSHCLQLPHTYSFAHAASGGTVDTLDLEAFAGRLVPSAASLVAAGWEHLEAGDAGPQRNLAGELRQLAIAGPETGDLAGLLFGDPARFLTDLADNLNLRAAGAGLRSAADTAGDTRGAVRDVLRVLGPYQERTGFVDAYGGPMFSLLNEPLARLGDPGLDVVLRDFTDWRRPAVRNGIVPRLLAAMRAYAG